MITYTYANFNGVVAEKYNVTDPLNPHKVDVEYGNQGRDFVGVNREGSGLYPLVADRAKANTRDRFGWVNASFVVGLGIISKPMRHALSALADWDAIAEHTEKSDAWSEQSVEASGPIYS